MFGTNKPNEPRPLNDSGRSLISETFSLEGTLRTSGAMDVAGLIKGAVYTNDLVIKESSKDEIPYYWCYNVRQSGNLFTVLSNWNGLKILTSRKSKNLNHLKIDDIAKTNQPIQLQWQCLQIRAYHASTTTGKILFFVLITGLNQTSSL